MRSKEELYCIVFQMIMGIGMMIMGIVFLATSTKGYIGLWEGIVLILMVGGLEFLIDGGLTIHSEITGTSKKTVFKLYDDEES